MEGFLGAPATFPYWWSSARLIILCPFSQRKRVFAAATKPKTLWPVHRRGTMIWYSAPDRSIVPRVPLPRRAVFQSTRPSRARRLRRNHAICRRVKRWQGSDHRLRWVASALLYAETRWNRLTGYRYLPLLIHNLQRAYDMRCNLTAVTVAAHSAA